MIAPARQVDPQRRAELEHVGLTEALELCLLLVDKAPDRFGRAALPWHGRYCREVRDVDLTESQAVLATLSALAGERKRNAAFALARTPKAGDVRGAGRVG
jgi:hypothetical protein